MGKNRMEKDHLEKDRLMKDYLAKDYEGLKFLGTGSAFHTELGNNSAYFVIGSTLYLIDCGGSVFHRLKGKVLFKEIQRVEVFLTHLHPDHVGSLGDLIFYLFHMQGICPTIHFPKLEKLEALLQLQGVRGAYFVGDPKEVFSEEELNIRFLSQEHNETLDAYGLLIKKDGFRCFYSGDSKRINETAYELLRDGEIDFFYQDTCSYKSETAGHLFIGDLEEQVPMPYRSRFICMHLDEEFSVERAKTAGFQVATEV